MNKPNEKRFWEKVTKIGPDDCWNWTGSKNKTGYGRFGLQYGKRRKQEISSRYCYMISTGEIPPNLYVLHECDNPSCCNPAHLYLGTLKDNAQDRARKGRNANHKGEHNGRHKLTFEQVKEIRKTLIKGSKEFGAVALGKKYGVSNSAIHFAFTGESWRDDAA